MTIKEGGVFTEKKSYSKQLSTNKTDITGITENWNNTF